MKNLIIGMIATVLFAFAGNAQTSKKKIIGCTTLSCCSALIFNIEIWSQTTCYYYYSLNRQSIEVDFVFKDGKNYESIELNDDYLIPGSNYNDKALILKKGNYELKNNTLSIDNSNNTNLFMEQSRIRCIQRVINGEFFGHQYSSTVTVCFITAPFLGIVIFKNGKENGKGYIELDLNLKNEDLEKLSGSENKDFILKDDVTIIENDINYTIFKGTYKLNDNGKVVLSF